MNKLLKTGYFSTVLILLLGFELGCKKDQVKEIPILTTLAVKNLTTTSVSCGGNITSEGSAPIISRGVCWSVQQNPTNKYKDSITVDGTGLGIFNSSITGLKPGTTYYIRAYASTSAGTGYGNQVPVIIAAVVPTLTTVVVSTIGETAVNSGGAILSDGGAPVFRRGVCWSTTKNPTIDNLASTDGMGGGSFSSSVTDLDPEAIYYLRAYATNSIGTAYGNELSFSIGKLLVKDMDGNYYHFVTIGSQIWMVENLKTTRYRDSTSIPLVESSTTWSNQVVPGYCWYNDDEALNKNRYGALYNWYAVSSGKLCPVGWHVPSDTEWIKLTDYLGGESLAGGKLKEIGTSHWKNPNIGAINVTGFTALPGGYRTNIGEYGNIGSYGNWWSTTSVITNVANYRYIYYGNEAVTKSFVNQKYGLSVRCLKN